MLLLSDWSEAMKVKGDGTFDKKYPDSGTKKYSSLEKETAPKSDLRKKDLILCIRTLAEIMLPHANIGKYREPDWQTILAPRCWNGCRLRQRPQI